MGIEATIKKVEKIEDIMEYGIMKTPAFVVDDQVKVMSKVSSAEDM